MIADGAVGMVEMAKNAAKKGRILELDEGRKAAMASNLVVLAAMVLNQSLTQEAYTNDG